MSDPHTRDLARLVVYMQAETGLVDPRELAGKVLAELREPQQLYDALAEALPEYVRAMLRTERNSALHGVGGAQSGTSAGKVGLVRARHARLLAVAIHVPGAQARWKTLKDCTRDDLLAVASYRRQVAERNLSIAAEFEELARHLEGSATVADLPETVVLNAFGGAA